MDYLYILIGLALLFGGGEALVRGGVAVASRMSVPPLVIGVTVVGFGTSTPELLVSVQAALGGAPDIAIGNVIGSNIASILLIVGLTAVIWPIRVSAGALRRDVAVMVPVGALLVPLFVLGEINRFAAATLLAGQVAYLIWVLLTPGPVDRQESPPPIRQSLLLSTLLIAGGLGALMLGARCLIDGAVAIARGFGLSEAFIGLTIVAVGTSLPELATSLIAALRRASDIAIGNVVGSNIFNILGIPGVTGLIAPIPVAPRFLSFDLPVMLVVSVGLALLLILRPQIGRVAGVLLLLSYVAYVLAAR